MPCPGVRDGASLPVVRDRHVETAAHRIRHHGHPHLDRSRLAVLHRVGERFGGDEIGIALPFGRQDQAGRQLGDHSGRDRAAIRERLERRDESPIEQDRRGESAGQGAQLVEGLLRLGERLAQQGASGVRILVQLPVGGGQIHLQSHQALLRSVVDVPLEPTQGGAFGRDGGAPGCRQVGHLLDQRVAGERCQHPARHPLMRGDHRAGDER